MYHIYYSAYMVWYNVNKNKKAPQGFFTTSFIVGEINLICTGFILSYKTEKRKCALHLRFCDPFSYQQSPLTVNVYIIAAGRKKSNRCRSLILQRFCRMKNIRAMTMLH